MTAECDRYVHEKLLLAHGELGHVAQFDSHLETCAACRAELAELRELRRQYREASTERMPEDLQARILAAKPPFGGVPRWQRWSMFAAAAILLAILALPLLRPRTPPHPPTPADASFGFETIDPVRDDVRRLEQPPSRISLIHPPIDDRIRSLRNQVKPLRDDEW